jgi:hypothetical protein
MNFRIAIVDNSGDKPMTKSRERGLDDEVVEGAIGIAIEYYGSADKSRRVHLNVDGLPLFKDHGRVCAFRSQLRAHKEARRKRLAALRRELEKTATQPPALPAVRRRRAVEATSNPTE